MSSHLPSVTKLWSSSHEMWLQVSTTLRALHMMLTQGWVNERINIRAQENFLTVTLGPCSSFPIVPALPPLNTGETLSSLQWVGGHCVLQSLHCLPLSSPMPNSSPPVPPWKDADMLPCLQPWAPGCLTNESLRSIMPTNQSPGTGVHCQFPQSQSPACLLHLL